MAYSVGIAACTARDPVPVSHIETIELGEEGAREGGFKQWRMLDLGLDFKRVGSAEKLLAVFHFGLCFQTLLQCLYLWMMVVDEKTCS